MFTETITITINSVAKILSRINQDAYGSEYRLRESTGEFRLKIRNTTYSDKTRPGVKVDRHNVELIQEVYPVAPAVNSVILKAYSVFENDQGITVTDAAKFATGMYAFHTEANNTKLINFES